MISHLAWSPVSAVAVAVCASWKRFGNDNTALARIPKDNGATTSASGTGRERWEGRLCTRSLVPTMPVIVGGMYRRIGYLLSSRGFRAKASACSVIIDSISIFYVLQPPQNTTSRQAAIFT